MVKRGLRTKDEWLEERPTFSRSTLELKLLNYGYLDGENNRSGVSHQARYIYNKYHNEPDAVLMFVWRNRLWNI